MHDYDFKGQSQNHNHDDTRTFEVVSDKYNVDSVPKFIRFGHRRVC